LDVTLCDISETALDFARARAREAGVSVETLALDLEQEAMPAGPWDLVVSFDYLQRDLFPLFPEILAPGGLLVFSQPTRSNLERHPRPGSTHLLEDGELPTLVRGLTVLFYEERWCDDDRHHARLVAQKR
jgi:SAM-dependent methyltransferase